MEEIHEDPAFKSLFVMTKVRGNEYSGPDYAEEFKALVAALTETR